MNEILNDMNNLHEHLRLIVRVMEQYSIYTTDDANTYNRVMTTLADCVEMYVARLEVATERAIKAFNGGGAAA